MTTSLHHPDRFRPAFHFFNHVITGYLPTRKRVYEHKFPLFRDRADLQLYRKILLERIQAEGPRGARDSYNKTALELLDALEMELFDLI